MNREHWLWGIGGVGWALLLLACRAPDRSQTHIQPAAVPAPPALTTAEPAAVKVDYAFLEQQLAAGDFNGANQETWKILRQLSPQPTPDNPFPCADLHRLDRLWIRYSDGRFGFSVQQQLWQQETANRNGQWIGDAVYRFCDRIGWGSCELAYNQANFSLAAPIGHLPTAILPLADEGYDPESGRLISFGSDIKPTHLLFLGRNPGTYEKLASVTEGFLAQLARCELEERVSIALNKSRCTIEQRSSLPSNQD